MAKDFKKGFSVFANAKAAESIMAKADEIRNIETYLIDEYSDNNEDITHIDDLVTSMKENGFTDPIEVTNYGCDDGRYMILSGHRRFAAWTQLHKDRQPIKCIIVDAAKFKNDNDVKNYVLMANAQRDSAKDPLLLVKRYGEHEKYLTSIGFKGSIRDEIANRLGISVQQADRYKTLGKCIPEIQKMVADEIFGMSTAQPIAPLSSDDQKKFYLILQDAIADDARLTRDFVKKMVDSFKLELWTWESIKAHINQEKIPSVTFSAPVFDNVSSLPEEKEPDRSIEVIQEFDVIEATDDEDDNAQEEYEAPQKVVSEKTIDDGISKERKNAINLIKTLKKLEVSLNNEFFDFEDEEAAVAIAKETISNIKEHIINPYIRGKK